LLFYQPSTVHRVHLKSIPDTKMNKLTFTLAVIFAVAIAADFIMVEAGAPCLPSSLSSSESAPHRGRWSAEAPLARGLKAGESSPDRRGNGEESYRYIDIF